MTALLEIFISDILYQNNCVYFHVLHVGPVFQVHSISTPNLKSSSAKESYSHQKKQLSSSLYPSVYK